MRAIPSRSGPAIGDCSKATKRKLGEICRSRIADKMKSGTKRARILSGATTINESAKRTSGYQRTGHNNKSGRANQQRGIRRAATENAGRVQAANATSPSRSAGDIHEWRVIHSSTASSNGSRMFSTV